MGCRGRRLLLGVVAVACMIATGAAGATEAQLRDLEQERRNLVARRDWLIVEFVAHALDDPQAAAHALASMGSVAGVFVESLTDNQRLVVGGFGAILAVTCALDEACVDKALRFMDMAGDVVDLTRRIDAISGSVGNRLTVSNQCGYPIRLAVTFRDLDDEWARAWWWTIDANTTNVLVRDDQYVRSASRTIYYYAETATIANVARWTGDVDQTYGGRTYGTRSTTLQDTGIDPYNLTLTCDGFVDEAGGSAETDDISVSGFVLPPLIRGDWAAVTGREAREIARALERELTAQGLPIGTFLQTRALRLPFYDDGHLVEVEGLFPDGRRGLYTLVRHQGDIYLLNGTSAVIHGMNPHLGLRIGTAEQAEAYLQFFTASIMGEEGSFNLMQGVQDFIWQPDATLDQQRLAVDLARPIEVVRRQDGSWNAVAVVNYSAALFQAEMVIQPDGMVEMTDDHPLATDLPVARQFFRDGVRMPQL